MTAQSAWEKYFDAINAWSRDPKDTRGENDARALGATAAQVTVAMRVRAEA